MREWPEVFRFGTGKYHHKHEAAADAKIGWALCQSGEKIPSSFKTGMEFISGFLGDNVDQNNCHKLWAKHKITDDRKARGMTQVEYADLLNVKENTVATWEQGIREPAPYFWFLLTFSTEALKVASKRSKRP